ncbi:hypothetical protein [Actinotalea sp. K2]|uniref:hypothetical protein n=1 Tax=Actinotalea sp. K2 TaxID=2939438 RepID=UPI002017AA90|nr:hypothetical protein [Actinotalea sp. K2]MCL3863026.1 hypothetical protein [Actinotalea sp. K2]
MNALTLALNVVGSVSNPMDGVTPSLAVWGVEFSGRVQIILGGLWALVLIATAGAVILGGGKWAWASRVTHSSDGVMEAAGQFKTALVAFGCVAGVSLILGAVIWLVQG